MPLRGIITQALQYDLLARIEDLRKLRAEDLERTVVGGVRAIKVTFRTMKNDPRYNSIILVSGSDPLITHGTFSFHSIT